MKIYIAHNYAARFELRGVVSALISMGHVVTSRWITDDSHVPNSIESAKKDLQDLDAAEALILFVDQFHSSAIPGKGKYIEYGYALAKQKYCYLIGEDTHCVFYQLPCVTRISSFRELPI